MEIITGSYRDPSGFMFRHDGALYRQVNAVYRDEYDHLLASGLYDELAGSALLVSHTEVDREIFRGPACYKILKPVPVPFVSSPSEWTFSQLKDAALLTLAIQQAAMLRGMSLKDASAFNIQFLDGKPVLIDTLSFERLRDGMPWVAYRQFCEHFLAPLALMSIVDPRLGSLWRAFFDGIPLDLACSLLPSRSFFRPSLLIHLFLHSRSQRRFADVRIPTTKRGMSLAALQGLVESLTTGIRRLSWTPADTGWSSYYETCTYRSDGFRQKKAFIQRIIEQTQPKTVWDLGANTGEFSRIASASGAFTLALDSDMASVERLYQTCKAEGETRVLPLVMDIVDPTPGMGWVNAERSPFLERGTADLALVLALVHHLAIGRNVPFEMISDLLARSASSIIAEFIPKEDPQVQRLLRSRKDIFPFYTREAFEAALTRNFHMTEACPLPDSGRVLYHCTRHS
jgi:hypothetical protein